MEPEEVVFRLGEGIQKIQGLDDVRPSQREEAEMDAFVAVRDAIKGTRRDKSLLDDFSEPDMALMVDFIYRYGMAKKKVSRQAKESLKLLILNDSWHRAVHASQGMLEKLQPFLADFPGAKERLDETPAEPAAAIPDPAEPKAPARTETSDATEEGIRTMLREGVAVMERLGWEFPKKHVTAQFDEGTQGHRKVYEGLIHLAAWCRTPEGTSDVRMAEKILAQIGVDWANVLGFLCSMYSIGTRKTIRSRIRHSVSLLMEFSPQFRQAASERQVPWADATEEPLVESPVESSPEPSPQSTPRTPNAESIPADKDKTAVPPRALFEEAGEPVLLDDFINLSPPADTPAADAPAAEAAAAAVAGAVADAEAAALWEHPPSADAEVEIDHEAQGSAAADLASLAIGSYAADGSVYAFFSSAPPEPEGQKPAPSRSSQLKGQFGKYGICNETPEELKFCVEQTGEDFWLKPNSDKVFHASLACVNVRINRVGLFGWRTRVARVPLAHQNFYVITGNSSNGINCVASA